MALTIGGGGALEFDAIINGSQFQSQLNAIENQINGLTRAAEREANSIEKVAKNATAALASYASFAGASSLVSDIIKVRGEFQKIEAVLSNSLGSNSEAEASLKMISDYAATTPFQLNELANAYVKLVNQGFKPTKAEMTALGDLAASTGKSFDQLAEAIIDAQTGEFERLKEFGIRASKEGDKVAFTFKGVKTQVDFTSESITNYITGLGQLQGVSGATAAISATLEGQVSNLADSFDRMLNEIGQSGEGVFSGSIEALNTLVSNYRTVLDVLKVMVVTYGTYRVATILAASATQGYTIAETLRYRAMLISEATMKLLNKTMLANPAVAVSVGIAALASALYFFSSRTNEAAEIQEKLNNVQKRSQEILLDEKSKLESLLKIAKDETASKEARLNAVKNLNELAPEYLGNLTLESLKTQEGTRAINEYVKALERKAKQEAAAETTKEIDKQILGSKFEMDQALRKRKSTDSRTDAEFFEADPVSQSIVKDYRENLKVLQDQKKAVNDYLAGELKATLEAEGGKQAAIKRTVEQIDKEITAKKKEQSQNSETSKQYQQFEKEINALQEERKRIVGETKQEHKSALAQQHKDEAAINKLIEERKDLLQSIADTERGARATGMTRDLSEIEKINVRYDEQIRKIAEFNKKADEYNAKHKNKATKVGLTEVSRLNDARNLEIDNAGQRQSSEVYIKGLDQQQRIFEQYEESKKRIGVESAKELYNEQAKGFESYSAYLLAEYQKIAPKFVLGIANLGDKLKGAALLKEMKKAQDAQAEMERKNIESLIASTQSAAQKRLSLEAQYEKDLAALRKANPADLADREKVLKEAKDADLKSMAGNIAGQSKAWRKLNQDIVGFTRQRIKQEIAAMQLLLKSSTVDEKTKQAIRQVIQEWKAADKGISDSKTSMEKLSEESSRAAGIFMQLAQATEGIDQGLSNALGTLGSFGQLISGASDSMQKFQDAVDAKDMEGMISAGSSMVGGALAIYQMGQKMIADAKKSWTDTFKAISDFKTNVITGELAINELYRQRALDQARLNKSKLDGLKAEKKLLEDQKKQVESDAASLLAKLQKEQYVKGTTAQLKRGVLGLNFGKVETKEVMASLAGKSFEDIEKLFLTNQLTDKAKALFEQLQKLKQEGVDIDRQLQELAEQSKQLFTGTTADSLTDSIAQMFQEGKTSADDFAQFFEDRMGDAALSIFKNKAIAEQMQRFYEEFAAAAQSGETLTEAEISQLREGFTADMAALQKQFEQMQQVTGLKFTSAAGTTESSSANNMQNALKALTEETGGVIAGRMGALSMTALEQLQVSRQGLDRLLAIENNTSMTVARLENLTATIVKFFREEGVKMK